MLRIKDMITKFLDLEVEVQVIIQVDGTEEIKVAQMII
jgi:hypothetical protein